jgi:hypothetical protein
VEHRGRGRVCGVVNAKRIGLGGAGEFQRDKDVREAVG